jgi:NAD(P)-dependent dehydrogenase (short-subunit alcohol dehydrogenase family)
MFEHTGLNIPKVDAKETFPLYMKFHEAVQKALEPLLTQFAQAKDANAAAVKESGTSIIAEIAKVAAAQIEFNRRLTELEWITTPTRFPNRTHVYQTYHVLAADYIHRDSLISSLKEAGIETNLGAQAVHCLTYFKKKYDRLDVLINNAGASFSKREVTSEGFERNFAVNYLGPFLLTHELLDLLKSSAPSRIINVSSGLAKNGKVNLDDLQSEKNYIGTKFYSPSRAPAYDNAKLMLMMFTYELARRLKGSGVTVNVLMPGFTATNLGKNSGSLGSYIMFKMVRPMQQSARREQKRPFIWPPQTKLKTLRENASPRRRK